MELLMQERLAIAEVVNNWALWRDAGFWDRFRTVWHKEGWMSATWFQGPAEEFIGHSIKGFEAGNIILHFLGGVTVDLAGDRAIAQTKMTITQRGPVEGVEIEVVCTGRFYDFFEKREGQWGIVRRQPIYERDHMKPVHPSDKVSLDKALLESLPVGYRNLAYLQTRLGFKVKSDMPGLKGDIVQALYKRGQDWLDGKNSALPV